MTSVLTNYYPTVGDSRLAQVNRMYELVTGSLPTFTQSNDLSSIGNVSFSLSYQSSNNTIALLNQQSEDIQVAVSAMETSGKGLEMIKTRIGILDGLAGAIQQYPDISNIQRDNINEQINYVLDEIYEISQTQNFNGVEVLDGVLATDGVYVTVVGSDVIDITSAFNKVDPESLGLPMQGEAYVTSYNVNEFFQQLSNAESKINTQLDDVVEYSKVLAEKFEIVSEAIYQSSIASSGTFSAGILGSMNYYSQSDSGLSLSMGNISSAVRVDTSFYDRMKELLLN